MLEKFYERINLNFGLAKLSKIICQRYNLGKYVSEEIILVGYEDFNFVLTTDKGKYCVKVFNKDRTCEDIKMYIDRIKLSNILKINTPKVYKCNKNILCEIDLDNVNYRLCVFQYIDGKSFYDLNELPTIEEIKNIIFQMSKIHSAKLQSDFIYDNCTITNFIKEYEEKVKYLDIKYTNLFETLVKKLKNVKFDNLPIGFVHGDIIRSNVIKDNNGKLWIIDFAVSNYLPRIVDLAVAACDMCLNSNNKEETIKSTKMIIEEYQKYNKLTNYELECFPLFYDLVNAIGILQISYLSSFKEISKEDKFWLEESEKGLNFSKKNFWSQIIKKI